MIFSEATGEGGFVVFGIAEASSILMPSQKLKQPMRDSMLELSGRPKVETHVVFDPHQIRRRINYNKTLGNIRINQY